MSKTLADMSAEERADCVGMWADTTGQGLGVVVNATEPSDCWVLFSEGGGRVATCHNQRVTPRFDLPRVWTPDGEPVPLGKVQRLQSAVQQMLCELNIYQEQENIGRVREVALDTIETYGLTKEDME